MKKFNSAVKAYVRATQIKPDAAPAHLAPPNPTTNLRIIKTRLNTASRARQLDPNQAQVLQMLGNIYDAQKDYEQAIAAYKRALELDPKQPKVMDSLAQAYLRAASLKPANELLVQVVAIEPSCRLISASRLCRI